MENLSFIYLRYFKFELINLFQWFKYFECTELSKSALLWNDWQGIQYFIEFGSFWKAFNFVDIGIHNFEPIALQKFKLHRYYPEKILRRISDYLIQVFYCLLGSIIQCILVPLWNFFSGKTHNHNRGRRNSPNYLHGMINYIMFEFFGNRKCSAIFHMVICFIWSIKAR